MLLGGDAGYIRDDFSGIDRTDDTIDVGAGASYLINRQLLDQCRLRLHQALVGRRDEEFDRNLIRVGVTGAALRPGAGPEGVHAWFIGCCGSER